MSASRLKDPDARLDYAWHWTPWLAATAWSEADTIVSAEVTAELGLTVDGTPAIVTVTEGDPAVTYSYVVVWLTGGTDGEDYRVTCRITTAAGRVEDRTLNIHVTER